MPPLRALTANDVERAVALRDPDLVEASHDRPRAVRGQPRPPARSAAGPRYRGYEELAQRSVDIDAGDLHLKVLDLPTLIEIKSSTGRVRDRLVVPLLLALLRERESTSQD